MPTTFRSSAIPAVRVAELTAVAERLEPECITPVIQPLYRELGDLLGRAGLAPSGPAIAYSTTTPQTATAWWRTPPCRSAAQPGR